MPFDTRWYSSMLSVVELFFIILHCSVFCCIALCCLVVSYGVILYHSEYVPVFHTSYLHTYMYIYIYISIFSLVEDRLVCTACNF